jgi:Arc/MetJ family transcription regulator
MRRRDIFARMAKRLVDIDEKALAAARAELGTRTLKDTVNEALRRAAPARNRRVARALDTLAKARLGDRSAAWR